MIGEGHSAFPIFFSEVQEIFEESKALTLEVVQIYRLFKAHGDPWGGIGWSDWPTWFHDLIDIMEEAGGVI